MISFWGYNAFLLYIDVTGKPEFLQRYKIQEEKNVPVRLGGVYLRHCVQIVLHFSFSIGIELINLSPVEGHQLDLTLKNVEAQLFLAV